MFITHFLVISSEWVQDPLKHLRWDLWRQYLAALTVIYCHTGLDATCFQGFEIHLLCLFIIIFSKLVVLHFILCYYYYHSKSIYL